MYTYGQLVNINMGPQGIWVGKFANQFSLNGGDYINVVTNKDRQSTTIDMDADPVLTVTTGQVSAI